MSSISSVAISTPTPVSSGPGDNNSSAAGGVDFDDVLKQLYAIEDECDKAIGELSQKVEQMAKGADATAGKPAAAPNVASDVSPSDTSSIATTSSPDATSVTSPELQSMLAAPDSSEASLANYMKAMQSYTKAQVLPDLNAALLFATSS